ncbi:hypothetical protein [Asticcacaulis sp. AC402]|uniref:hypothetical protein n=1 Tax=Asticcacaulis sp. AC402 TaxID=1282361 RepID=UPI0003C3D24D|nr:hypothetical protein [Asticcacaulis sp. AC402]ESQ73590.1 hypothetical protein ABAC402_18375 [Asticcacaulis sp. AC402]
MRGFTLFFLILTLSAAGGAAQAAVSPKPDCVAIARPDDKGAIKRVDCFAIDKASDLRHWSSITNRWANLGRVSANSRSLSCLRSQDGYLHCFYVRTDGQIWHRRWNPESSVAATSEPIGGVPSSPLPGYAIRPGFVDHMDNELVCTESGSNNIACLVRVAVAPDGRFYAEPGLYLRRFVAADGRWMAWQGVERGDWRANHCRRSGTSIDYCTLQRRELRDGILVTRHKLLIFHDYSPPGTGGMSGEAPVTPLWSIAPHSGPLDAGGAAYPPFAGGLSCLHVVVANPSVSSGQSATQHCFGITDTRRLYYGQWAPLAGPMAWTELGSVVLNLSPASGSAIGDEQTPNCLVMNPPVAGAALPRPENLILTCVQVTGERMLHYYRLTGGRWTTQAIATTGVVTGAPSCVVVSTERLECAYRSDPALGRMNRLSLTATATGAEYRTTEIGRGFVYPRPPL